MKNALFLAIPSVYESLSLVLLESFFMRTPVVVNEQCDVLKKHVIQSNGGMTFSNYTQFINAVDLFLENPDLRVQMGNKGHQYVSDNYCWDTVIEKFDVAIHDIHTAKF
jgi:glycosyltransferase involved in cell wall biosynthesis